MWTPFAHQPSRVQPVQARPSSNPSIFSAPSLLSCRAGALQQQPAASSPQPPCVLRSSPSMPLPCPISPASARASCAHASFLPALRLVGYPVGLYLTILSI